MASSTASQVKILQEDCEDDEGFDWDAAVWAIDMASEASVSKPAGSTRSTLEDPFRTPCVAAPLPPRKPRQSKLDKFFGRPGVYNEATGNAGVAGEGRVDEGIGIRGTSGAVEVDAEAAKTWIYPVNVPLRDYQLSITKTALFSNTLVALPTGLGKTLIAAVVMYNYFKWFPKGKIVFAAPSRPLVLQQIEACLKIVGIPQEQTIDMTGQVAPAKRAHYWKSKRVFFVTPQVLEKDIQSGSCLAKYLVCLVIDEAHRAMGNYSYSVVVRELMAIPVQLRILGLTATPGSKHQTIQQVIDNLLISTLEYRNESDPDVIPYVHERKMELVKVTMGKEAIEIYDLLLNVMCNSAARLNRLGINFHRDYQTSSPQDFLHSREKFRQAPPMELPEAKYGEVEHLFGVLITLCHIRKLLSSHGITPAHEMLEEKMQRRSFGSFITRNEDLRKARFLMQQSSTHGAPNPKLSKMLEVLVDHFKTNNAQQSRVIIFSNFRGSVRDILNVLSKLGEVKAAQFIGQSSGKSLKGQSQKVQQTVLEKFRSGEYNVIVATSIGEEGLDIMEVDLVICFDANISPLRMIQRMGRTGRKHDGPCEGSELKGYLRKQGNSKAVRKLMHNGGAASFNFHPSPRMIPHIFKPEVRFLKLSIEKYIPQRKKVIDGEIIESVECKKTLTKEEQGIISKYFHNYSNEWRPSLIAFPAFQNFPSRVHKVMHSSRTSMLIDAMQNLQGLPSNRSVENHHLENEDEVREDLHNARSIDEKDARSEEVELLNEDGFTSKGQDFPPTEKMEEDRSLHLNSCDPSGHTFLFGSEFVTVDPVGIVQILSVPTTLPFVKSSEDVNVSINSVKEGIVSSCGPADRTMSPMKCESIDEDVLLCRLTEIPLGKISSGDIDEEYKRTRYMSQDSPSQKGNDLLQDREDNITTPDASKLRVSQLEGGHNEDQVDVDMSPRLSCYLKCGVVPESPVNGESEDRDIYLLPTTNALPAGLCPEINSGSSPKGLHAETISGNCNLGSPACCNLSTLYGTSKDHCNNPVHNTASPVASKSVVTPISSGYRRNWLLSPAKDNESVERRKKLKRLRRVGDCPSVGRVASDRDHSVLDEVPKLGSKASMIRDKLDRGKKKQMSDARAFIEVEAEASSDDEASTDEEEDTYDDSFIDDITDSVAAESSAPVDMMAVYRRSLLSQSPNIRQLNGVGPSPLHSVTASVRSDISSSTKSLRTPQSGPNALLRDKPIGSTINYRERLPGTDLSAGVIPLSEVSSDRDNRERSCLTQAGHVHPVNLYRLFTQTEKVVLNKEGLQRCEDSGPAVHVDDLNDDLFYEGLDLDEVEAQATLLLCGNSEFPNHDDPIPGSGLQKGDCPKSPSFDLGI
ncbi:hypothetical protein MLD38_034605 [Melastoma candidum]|uniref:Uncharacterized protein n=1 Tax=Melastoma candidum TaxID=119954 RepID=A0ACB9MA74_9MYRT|nr:hypothetical protein MLD38_034605 [Melastoma candidum]